MPGVDLVNPPQRYWHCAVKIEDAHGYHIVNDLTYADLERTILVPWRSGRAFTVSGLIVRPNAGITEIKIAHTTHAREVYAARHNQEMQASGIADLATNRSMLPFRDGIDATYDLLFSGANDPVPIADVALVERICQRLPQAARILGARTRQGKPNFELRDEYDVQDLLHAVLRAYLKYSVREDPLPKVASAKSGKADISIEELGVIIEIKFVRRPEDQRRVFEEYSQDLLLYARWPHLKNLIYLIYNSGDLLDPEAFEKLSGEHEIDGTRFSVSIVLA